VALLQPVLFFGGFLFLQGFALHPLCEFIISKAIVVFYEFDYRQVLENSCGWISKATVGFL